MFSGRNKRRIRKDLREGDPGDELKELQQK
jgi:hypothetical protein